MYTYFTVHGKGTFPSFGVSPLSVQLDLVRKPRFSVVVFLSFIDVHPDVFASVYLNSMP